jgi:hypothetical protein
LGKWLGNAPKLGIDMARMADMVEPEKLYFKGLYAI